MLPRIKNNIIVILSVVFMAMLALFREVIFFPIPDLIPNPDTAWLVYAAQRVAQGQKLYVDIMETNPPLIIWLSLPAVYLGNWLRVNPAIIFQCFVTAISLISVYLVGLAIKKHNFFADKLNYNIIIIYIVFGLFLLTPAIYGQREMLFIALVLPYLFISRSSVVCNLSSIIMVLMAAIGFAIKPFFLLLWGMNELVIACERRKISTIFAWHNWFIGLFQIAYLTAVYFITPEYITDLFPALMATYFTFQAPWWDLIRPILKITVPTIIAVLLAKLSGEYKNLALRIAVWLAACVGLILVQRKDWLNHLYPMFFMAGLLLSVALIFLIRELKILGQGIGHRKFTALCLVVALFSTIVYLDTVFTRNIFIKPSKISIKLIKEIESKASGKYVYPLVSNIQPSFPAILLSSGVFHGGFHHLWPLTGIIIREQHGDSNPEFTKAKKWFMDSIVRDFTDYPPALVWVNDNVNMEMIAGNPINPENRDFIKVLSRDERFAKIWQNYTKYMEIENELYPDEVNSQSEEEKKKKPEHYSLYIRKNQ